MPESQPESHYFFEQRFIRIPDQMPSPQTTPSIPTDSAKKNAPSEIKIKLKVYQVKEQYSEPELIVAHDKSTADEVYRYEHAFGSNYYVSAELVGEIDMPESILERVCSNFKNPIGSYTGSLKFPRFLHYLLTPTHQVQRNASRQGRE